MLARRGGRRRKSTGGPEGTQRWGGAAGRAPLRNGAETAEFQIRTNWEQFPLGEIRWSRQNQRMTEDCKTARYGVRRDGQGWTVFEAWTGDAVVLAQERQVGLSEVDAEHTADLLNQRALAGDPSMRA
jgi:hypothetical protein